MTVDPGFGQQAFLHWTLPKIRRVRQMIDQINSGCDLEVDGGIDATTAPLVVVAGTSVFGDSEGVAAGMDRLRASIEQAAN